MSVAEGSCHLRFRGDADLAGHLCFCVLFVCIFTGSSVESCEFFHSSWLIRISICLSEHVLMLRLASI